MPAHDLCVAARNILLQSWPAKLGNSRVVSASPRLFCGLMNGLMAAMILPSDCVYLASLKRWPVVGSGCSIAGLQKGNWKECCNQAAYPVGQAK